MQETTLLKRAALSPMLMLALAAAAWATSGTAPVIDRLRVFLIYEDTGAMSKDLAKDSEWITANDENGFSVQVLIDIVLSGEVDRSYENNPFLHVVVRDTFSDASAPPLVNTSFPLSYVGSGGELTRTIVVDHGCGQIALEAYIMDGPTRTSELLQTMTFGCGD